jgi:predicted DNA-binding transcriptional regulator YafY
VIKKDFISNSKLERISYLYDRLSKSSATISELANELNVSTKTIQRDLHDILSKSGAVCDGRRWMIDKSKADDNLRGDEKIVLAILDELAKSCGRQFYLKAHNLIEQISSNISHPIFANTDSEALNPEHLETFARLEEAIKNKTPIKCSYNNRNFELKPLKLAFFDGFWYLLCLDANSNDIFKKFHLKTIKNIEMQSGSFDVPFELEERLANANSIWFQLDREPFEVRLFLEKEAVIYFERKPLKSQTFAARYSDGSAEISIIATYKMEVFPIVKWYMPLVKIVEPKWLADEMREMLAGYLREVSN